MGRLLWMGCLCYVLTGFTLVIVGSVLPELLAFYGKSYNDGGLLVFIQFIGLLCGVLCMPVFTKLAGRRWTVVLGLLFLSVETCFVAAPSWGWTTPILFAAGFGAGLVEASIGSLVLLAAGDRPAAAMSRLEITFGIGALTMPFLVSFLIKRGAWIYAFPTLGLGSLLLAAVWMFLRFGPLNRSLRKGVLFEVEGGVSDSSDAEKTQTIPSSGARLSRTSVFVLCALFFSLYGGSEASLIHFLPSVYIEDRMATASAASLVVTVYWVGMVIGRAVTGLLADRFGYYPFLLVSTLGAVLSLALTAMGGGLWSGFALAFCIGLFMSGMFAIALIFANQQIPGRTDKTTSLLMAVNGLGGALLPYLAGWTMETFSANMTVWLLTISMGCMLLFLVLVHQLGWITRWSRRAAEKR
ncbi:MFS transporter [Paenibacillus ginsengarvi]|uniref:MFS transporter n=1 Tax=Paenibacillus ginsengarvi TaxID=400777 RepID=UPI0013159E3E|nr:MFS transporter [Paenibacillus ginsengarvi]